MNNYTNNITDYLSGLEITELHKIIQTCSEIIDSKTHKNETKKYAKSLSIINESIIPILENETIMLLKLLTLTNLQEIEIFGDKKLYFTMQKPFKKGQNEFADDYDMECDIWDPYHRIVLVYNDESREKVYILEEFKHSFNILKYFNLSVSALIKLNQLYKELLEELYKNG